MEKNNSNIKCLKCYWSDKCVDMREQCSNCTSVKCAGFDDYDYSYYEEMLKESAKEYALIVEDFK